MNWKKIRTIGLFAVVIVAAAAVNIFAAGNVELNIIKTLQLEATPIDVAITPDGRQIFVLNDRGEILVYSSGQNLEGNIKVNNQSKGNSKKVIFTYLSSNILKIFISSEHFLNISLLSFRRIQSDRRVDVPTKKISQTKYV